MFQISLLVTYYHKREDRKMSFLEIKDGGHG